MNQQLTRETGSPRATGDCARALLAWYDRKRRVLPWRAPPGVRPDPYGVWLSEVMLQQTTAAAVARYYETFMRRWPTVRDLAAARLDEVLHAWAGLGYYARARNLHRCAMSVVDLGAFPDHEGDLRALPGIGPYTAAAIAAIAFERRSTPVDGNVERVMARLFAVDAPLPAAKRILRDMAATLTPESRCGDYAQAVMDLGATVCAPGTPACSVCPLKEACAAHARGDAAALPRRTPKPELPTRRGVAFWITSPDGDVLLRRRPENGLLGGLMEVPSTAWREEGWSRAAAEKAAPVEADWRPVDGIVRHAFTHFRLELSVLAARVPRTDGIEGVWCRKLEDHALPTVMKKVARLAGEDARSRKQEFARPSISAGRGNPRYGKMENDGIKGNAAGLPKRAGGGQAATAGAGSERQRKETTK